MKTGTLLPDELINDLRRQFIDGRPASDNPTVYCMSGIPGAGKSTFVNTALQSGEFSGDAYILDPDRVMAALPGYREDCMRSGPVEAYKKWEMPARDLAYAFFEEAKALRLDIIKDMGCARRENYLKLVDLKNAGYKIHMYYIECAVDEALRRAALRDRHTPSDMIRVRAASLLELIPDYQKLADSFVHLDNTDLSRPWRPVA